MRAPRASHGGFVRRWLAAVSCSILGLGHCASGARAHDADIDLRWTAPEHCPQRPSLQSGLEQRLGRPVQLGDDAQVRVAGTVDNEGDGYTLELTTQTREGSERRKLQARGCNELARASVLVAALLLSESTHEAPHAIARALEPSSPGATLRLFVRALFELDLGALPKLGFGPALLAGIQLGNTRLELGGVYLLPQQAYKQGIPTALASLQLWAARVGVCQAVLQSPMLAPCLQAELGQLRGRGLHLRSNLSDGATWSLFSAGLQLAVELGSGVWWQSELFGGLTGNRARFGIRDVGFFHEVPSLVGRVCTGLELRF